MFKLLKKFFSWLNSQKNRAIKSLINAFRLSRMRRVFGQTFHLDKALVLALHSRKMPSVRQLKYLPRFLGRSEQIALLILLLMFFISGGFLGTMFYFAHRVFVPDYGGEFTEAIVGAPRNINPLYSRANPADADLVALIYSGLLRYDGNGVLIPDLAETYEISGDSTVYTFKLRADVRFHDGVPVRADDILFTIQSIQDSAWKSPLNVSFAGVSIEKIDDFQVRFKLKEPFAPFLETLTVGILPKHLWRGIQPASARLAELNIKPIGSGPFRFRSFVRSKDGTLKSYAVARNDLFYRKRPYLERIVFYFYPDYLSAVTALKNHEVAGISYLADEGLSSLELIPANRDAVAPSAERSANNEVDKNPELEYYKLKLPQYTALFFNVKKSNILSELKVRKALTLSLDKDQILAEATRTGGVKIESPILEGFLGFNPAIKPLPFDRMQSIELLESAGWKFSATGTVREKKKERLSLKLLTINRSEYLKAADIIAARWRAIGADVEVSAVPAANLQQEVIRPRDYDVLLYGEILGIDPDPYPFWHSSQVDDPGLNLSGFINREADQLLESARLTAKAVDRAALYQSFQNILAAEIPAIFLYTPNYIYPQRKIIRGFDVKIISGPSGRFTNVEDWYIKTKRSFR